MNLKVIIISLSAVFLIALSSCQKKPKCKSCSVYQTVYEDGVVISTQSTTGNQYCDEDLEQIEENPYLTVTQTVGKKTMRTTTSYSCN